MVTKKKKRSEEIGIQIRENDKIYNKQLEESRRLLEIKLAEYNAQLNKAGASWDETKYKTAERLGKTLEKLGIEQPKKISARLKRDLKGLVHRSTIYKLCQEYPEWKNPSFNMNPRGTNRSTSRSKSLAISEPLTEQEQKFVDAVQDQYKRDERLADLLYLWTHKSDAEQGDIIRRTPKGSQWRKTLVEESKDHMLTIAKQMTDSEVGGSLYDIRTLVQVGEAFADILYEEQEVRKRKESLGSV